MCVESLFSTLMTSLKVNQWSNVPCSPELLAIPHTIIVNLLRHVPISIVATDNNLPLLHLLLVKIQTLHPSLLYLARRNRTPSLKHRIKISMIHLLPTHKLHLKPRRQHQLTSNANIQIKSHLSLSFNSSASWLIFSKYFLPAFFYFLQDKHIRLRWLTIRVQEVNLLFRKRQQRRLRHDTRRVQSGLYRGVEGTAWRFACRSANTIVILFKMGRLNVPSAPKAASPGK